MKNWMLLILLMVAILASNVSADNLLSNPSFEEPILGDGNWNQTAPTDWSTSGRHGNPASSNLDAYDGVQVIEISHVNRRVSQSVDITILEDKLYTFTVYACRPSGEIVSGLLQLFIGWGNWSDGWVHSAGGFSPNSESWGEYSITLDTSSTGNGAAAVGASELTVEAFCGQGLLLLDGMELTVVTKPESSVADAPKKMEIKETETPKMPDPVPKGWPIYHLAHPGPGSADTGDCNAAIYHKGRYHLHYIYNHHGYSFGHWSSMDMVYWKWHPTVLKKNNTGHGMFSGTAFRTLDDRVTIIYHGQGTGRNQLAFALDDNLDSWTQQQQITPYAADGTEAKVRNWDPDCWVIGDTYYSITGGRPAHLLKSYDLNHWQYLGPLLHNDTPDLSVSKNEDVSCANMFRIGDKWMLLNISHTLGCRYYLGDFKDEKYLPTYHGSMNWVHNNVFAPESLLTPDGRRVMWAFCLLENSGLQILEGHDFSALEKRLPTGIQTLPRELSLSQEGTVEIRPLRELKKLLTAPKSMTNVTVKDGQNMICKNVAGDTIELEVTFAAPQSTEFGLNVLCDKDGKNGVKIASGSDTKTLTVGYNNRAPFKLKEGEDLTLRVFIDKCMIEVFANNRQAVLIWHDDIDPELGVSLFSKGGDVQVKQLKGWTMKSIYGQ